MENRGFVGGIFDNDQLLWFILVFLVLFFCKPWGIGPVGPGTGC